MVVKSHYVHFLSLSRLSLEFDFVRRGRVPISLADFGGVRVRYGAWRTPLQVLWIVCHPACVFV